MNTAADLDFFQMLHQMRERSVTRLIIRYSKMMIARFEKMAAERGYPDFKPHYIGVLSNIGPDGTTSVEISRCIWITKQAVSKLVKEMEAIGYITYKPHHSDGRANMIHLTEKGKDLMLFSQQMSEELKAEMIGVVGEENVAHLIDTLSILMKDAEPKMANR